MAIQTLSDLKAFIRQTIKDNNSNSIQGNDVQDALINAIDTLDSMQGFVNVHKANGQTTINEYGSKAAARAAVPSDAHFEGVVIAYKLSTGWIIEQNLDATAGTWADDASWQTIGPVSVSQNTETGKEELLVGNTPVLVVDNEPEAGSDNLIKSNGVYDAFVRQDIYRTIIANNPSYFVGYISASTGKFESYGGVNISQRIPVYRGEKVIVNVAMFAIGYAIAFTTDGTTDIEDTIFTTGITGKGWSEEREHTLDIENDGYVVISYNLTQSHSIKIIRSDVESVKKDVSDLSNDIVSIENRIEETYSIDLKLLVNNREKINNENGNIQYGKLVTGIVGQTITIADVPSANGFIKVPCESWMNFHIYTRNDATYRTYYITDKDDVILARPGYNQAINDVNLSVNVINAAYIYINIEPISTEISSYYIQRVDEFEEIPQVVNSSMSVAELNVALNAKFQGDYALLCNCNKLCFETFGIYSIDEFVDKINHNFRRKVLTYGMGLDEMCNAINKAFTIPIYRFADAKTIPTNDGETPNIDWSIKAVNIDPNIDRDNLDTSEPSAIVSPDGSKLFLYAGGPPNDGRRWESTDGIHFTNETILQGVCDETSNYRVDHKNINLIDGVYYLVGVLHAREDNLINTLILCTSTDGINFTFQGKIFLPNTHIRVNMFPDEQEKDLIATYYGNSYLLKVESKWYLYFEIEDNVHNRWWEQCLATCDDIFHINADGEGGGVGTIGNWDFTCGQIENPNPIFSQDDGIGRGYGNVDFVRGMDNLPIKHDGKYYMYLHGGYINATAQLATTAIYRAYSYDLIHWTNEGTCFDNRDLPTVHTITGNGDQSTIEFKGKVRQYYSWDVNHSSLGLPAEIRIIEDDRPFCELLKLLP